MIKPLILSARPKQMVKNFIVFAALIFSNNLFVPDKALRVGLAFIVFCLLSGAVYLLNDVADIEKDRQHPKKCKRPLPSGQLSPTVAVIASIMAAGTALTGAFVLDTGLGIVASLYLINNLFYSFMIKHRVLLDVGSIAFGFVMRVLAGATVIDVEASPWLVMCTMLLALFLGFAKRRNELVVLGDDKENHRAVLKSYTPRLLDQLLMITASTTVMSYALYTISPATVSHFGTTKLIYTVPFVLYGVFRYLYLVHVGNRGGSPTQVLLTDYPLLTGILLWLATCVLIIEGIL